MCDAVGVNKPGSHVGPGESFMYIWQVLEGPSPSDSPCIPYIYYSGTEPAVDTNAGLVGPLLVCKKGVLDKLGSQVMFYYHSHTICHIVKHKKFTYLQNFN